MIAGAGAIGVEFAYVLNNYGVEVTIVEFLDRLVPPEDEEVSAELAKRYKKLGVNVLTSTRVESIDDSGDKVKVTVSPRRRAAGPRGRQGAPGDRLRAAASRATAWTTTGVELTERGAIEIDECMRTNVDGIFAIGDVTGKLMLAHTAEAMGVVAAETIAGAETMEIDYVMIPRATYCQPQIASFGYTEAQAKEQGYDVKVAKFPFTANGKAHGLGDAAASSRSSRTRSTARSSAPT